MFGAFYESLWISRLLNQCWTDTGHNPAFPKASAIKSHWLLTFLFGQCLPNSAGPIEFGALWLTMKTPMGAAKWRTIAAKWQGQ